MNTNKENNKPDRTFTLSIGSQSVAMSHMAPLDEIRLAIVTMEKNDAKMNKKDKCYMMEDDISEDEMRDMEFATVEMSVDKMVDLFIYLDRKRESASNAVKILFPDHEKRESEMYDGLVIRLNSDINTIGWTTKDTE